MDFVEAYLRSHGVQPVRVMNAEGNKAAIYASVGPELPGGIMLSGHSDVVPVKGQDWDSDPFTVTEHDGRLYGRGTCDMKGFVALALAAVPLALSRPLKRPLQIALSFDEETGMIGAPLMLDHMLAHGFPLPSAVIVGEPSMMQIVNGHKGGFGYQVHVRGHEVHSSMMHEGVSAVMIATELVSWANRMNRERAQTEPTPLAAEFVPPYSTIHVGTISGGTAHNITARDCHFEIDFRIVPDEDHAMWQKRFVDEVEALIMEMQAVHPDATITLNQDFGVAGLAPEVDGVAETLARQLTGRNGAQVVSFATEGGLFQERGLSTVICGPGDIAQAHQPNEFISVDQFQKGEAFMGQLVETLCAD